MKVLWAENHAPVRDMLSIAADKAARARVQVDLVLATSLLEAESRLRLERFNLVIVDLALPDSIEPDMTIARIANMGAHRIAVAQRDSAPIEAVGLAVACGCNIHPEPIQPEALPLNRFIQRPDVFEDFLLSLAQPKTNRARVAA
jgi:CheY-like chemotaxis protein